MIKIRNCETFLSKLYDILNIKDYNKIIHWNNEGTQIIISDIVGLTKKILPKFYKHNNYSSFVRQLNMYNFRKIKNEPTSDKNEEIFEHDEFKKNISKEEIQKIRRKMKKSKNNKNTNNTNNNNEKTEEMKNEKNEIISDRDLIKTLLMKTEENTKQQNEMKKEIEALKSQNMKLNNQIQLYDRNNLIQNNFFKKMKGLFIFLMALILKKSNAPYKICHTDIDKNG